MSSLWKKNTFYYNQVQVNLCQKPLFLHKLSHNMTTDCSLFMKIVSSEYLQNMLCTQIVVLVLFWHSEQFWYTTCSAASFWKRFTCTFWGPHYTMHGNPSPFWKISKMSLIIPGIFGPNYIFWRALKVPLYDCIQNMCQALSKCLNKRIKVDKLDYSKSNPNIKKKEILLLRF